MSLITFFQENIKPFKLRGTGIVHVLETSKYDEHLSAIRQDDVNMFLYTKNGTTIAIDAGYKNDKTLFTSLEKINIKNEDVKAVFITHGDIDHFGGIISKERFAPNAAVYLHSDEEKMILGSEKRFKVAFLRLKNPVVSSGEYTLLKDREIVTIGDITIECFHIPGHTKGHSAYLVDNKYLFTGDSIATNENGGYCFFNFYNMDTMQNIASLQKLKAYLSAHDDILVCTSHNGVQNIQKAFLHITEVASGTKRKPFDHSAPHDPFAKIL